MSSTESVQPGVYGNIIKPGRQGILGLSMGVSLAGVPFILLIVFMLVQRQYILALVFAVAGVVGALLMVATKRQGRDIYQRAALRTAQKVKERSGNHLAINGPAGRAPDGKYRLPGLLTASELSEHTDSYGNPFGLIRLEAARHYTIAFEAYPDGDALVDKSRIDAQISHWGSWLAQLGIEDGIIGASVTVETAPDSGLRLERMVTQNVSPEASDFATAVAGSITEELNGESPQFTTRLSITFSGRGVDKEGSDRGLATMADEIGNRIPVLLSGLYETGAGTSVRACTAQDIVDFTRSAYDPTVANLIEQARAEGGTGLTWQDAGPSFASDQVDLYFHDRAVSKSWQMFEGPRGMFYSNSLKRALEPTKGLLRKRVTLLYRPIPADKTTGVAEADINNATFAGSQKQRISARQKQRLAYAVQTAKEEAQGAGLVRFGMIITATCDRSSEFPRLDKIIPALGNPAKLRLRPALANQAVTFQAGLPLGVVLPLHMAISDNTRNWI